MPQSYVDSVRENMPPLPYELFVKYTKELGLSEYDAYVLTDSKAFALYFEEVIKHTTNYKGATNLLIGPVKSWLNEQSVEIEEFPIAPAALASIQTLVDEEKFRSLRLLRNYSLHCWRTRMLMLLHFVSKTVDPTRR